MTQEYDPTLQSPSERRSLLSQGILRLRRLFVQVANITTLRTDTITERTPAAGVTVDGVLLKDGVVTVGDVAFDDATSDPLPVDSTSAADGSENSVARKDHRHFATAATSSVQGIAELATAAETSTGTDTARVVPVVALPIQVQDSKYVYAADAEASDTYAITLTPAIAAYATGQVFHFKANTANTGAATLNVNAKGAKAILKNHDTALADNDIEAGQIVTVIYDGTQFQMQSQVANAGGGANHDILDGSVHQDSVADGVTKGSIVIGNATPKWDELVVGTDGQALMAQADGTVAWETPLVGAEKFSYSVTVEDPTSSEDITIAFTNRAITITEIRAVLIGSATPSVSWTIKHHATDRNNAGNAVVTAGTTTTSTTSGSDVTSFNDATIPADSFIWCETTAKSGTVDELHITIIGDVD